MKKRRRIVLAALAGAGATIGAATSWHWRGASDPTPGLHWPRTHADLARITAELRGLDWTAVVPVEAFDPDLGAIDDGTDPVTDGRNTATRRSVLSLGAIGLISQIEAANPGWLASGFRRSAYVPAEYGDGRIRLADDGVLSPTDRSLLVHELTHALNAQHFPDVPPASDDPEQNKYLETMLVEGDAILAQRDYAASLDPSEQSELQADQAFEGFITSVDDQRQKEFRAAMADGFAIRSLAEFNGSALGIDAIRAVEGDAGRNGLFVHPPRSQATYLSPTLLARQRVDKSVARGEIELPDEGKTWENLGSSTAITLAAALGILPDRRAPLDLVDAFAGGTAFLSADGRCTVFALHLTGPREQASGEALARLARVRGGTELPACAGARLFSMCGQSPPGTHAQIARAAGSVVYRLAIFVELIKHGIDRDAAEQVALEYAVNPANEADSWSVLTGWPPDRRIVASAVAKAKAAAETAAPSASAAQIL